MLILLIFCVVNAVQMLYAWRLYVAEQRREREEVAKAAQFYRDQLLREGVSCILTYAAHMNDLTATLTQHSQEQVGYRLFKHFHTEYEYLIIINKISAIKTSSEGCFPLCHEMEAPSSV